MKSTKMLRRILLWLSLSAMMASCEKQQFDGYLLAPDSEYIHYTKGYIVAPGHVDLSGLQFSSKNNNDNDDRRIGDGDDDRNTSTDNAEFESMVDLVMLPLPHECTNVHKMCDWTQLGIGASDIHGNLQWCCSERSASMGFCDMTTQYGRLLLDENKFQGRHRFIRIPPQGLVVNATLKYATLQVAESHSGPYALIFANCNQRGQQVYIDGQVVWKSKHGYLPGELFGNMYLCLILTALYFALMVWYGYRIRRFQECSIPVQLWIAGTIGIGCLEMYFRASSLVAWNFFGKPFWPVSMAGLIFGVSKKGLFRVLLVMISMGWGVVPGRSKTRLGLHKAALLGLLYVLFSFMAEIALGEADVEKLRAEYNQDAFYSDLRVSLTFCVFVMDMTFSCWIVDSLNTTKRYLESKRMNLGLIQQYRRFQYIIIGSFSVCLGWLILRVVDFADQGLLELQDEWIIESALEWNYLCVLAGVGYLWRPSPFYDKDIIMAAAPGRSRHHATTRPLVSDDMDDFDDDRHDNIFDDHTDELELSDFFVPTENDNNTADEYTKEHKPQQQYQRLREQEEGDALLLGQISKR